MNAKKRFWRILRMVAWERRRARTMPPKSPFSSVTPALSIATSVPVPIAIPTSAAARAGASLTPSPAMATICLHHETAGLIERARDHFAAGFLGHRHGLAGHQRLVERG